MINDESLLPECHADTVLIETIRGSKHRQSWPNHIFGISNVASNMQKRQGSLLIGIVDNDKQNTPAYFDNFIEVKSGENLIHKKHKDHDHHIIIICPAWEKWIWSNGEIVEIDFNKHGFGDWLRLMKMSKKDRSVMDQKVKNLLNTLHQKKAPGFVTLSTWIDDILAGKQSVAKQSKRR